MDRTQWTDSRPVLDTSQQKIAHAYRILGRNGAGIPVFSPLRMGLRCPWDGVRILPRRSGKNTCGSANFVLNSLWPNLRCLSVNECRVEL